MNTNEHAKNVQRFDRLVLTQVESIRRVGLSTLRDREHLDDLETISITGLSLHRMPSTGPDEGAAELE